MANNKKPYTRNKKTFDNKDKVKGYNKNNRKHVKNKVNDNSPQVRLDKERINDIETLDTSFLEGRVTPKKSNSVKEKLLNDTNKGNNNSFKYIGYVLLVFIISFGIITLFKGFMNQLDKAEYKSENKDIVIPSPSINVDMDNNYLFIGTFNTNKLDFKEDYHYIKVSEDHYNTNHILDDMVKQVYQYNPTYVFIELGINELYVESNKDFVDRLGKIIDGIKENRPYAKIYVESIYPINKDVEDFDNEIIEEYIDNEMINSVNKDIKKMVEEKEVKYLDLYSLLIEDDNLISDYTDNGVYLNDRGYMVVYDEINKIIG